VWVRVWSCAPGTATVLLLGLVGRDVAGERTGLLAAALATVSIALFTQDVILWSEGMFGFTIALTVLTAYRYLRRPDVLHGCLLAGAIALAALARAEGSLLFLILFVPLVVRQWGTPARQRWLQLGVGALVCLVLFAPWLVYNNTGGRFEHPVGLSVGLGTLIGSSNCFITYHDGGIGSWGGLCEHGLPKPLPLDESVQERLFRDAGLKYARNHADRLPLVVPIRVLRSFGFYAPVKMTADDLLLNEGGVHWAAVVAVLQYWLYLGIGVAGTVLLVRRKVPILPFVAPVVTVVVISVIGYGTMRFRIALDVVLPVLAAVALDALWRRVRGESAVPPAPPAPAPTAGTVVGSS
jgi:4-amino-4-deoxy-L-arabinose transferase-like glycosyltransferase